MAEEKEKEKISTFAMKVHMDCQGCREKIRKSLLKIDGIYGFTIDAKENKITVNAKASTDSEKVIERLSRMTGRRVQLWKSEEKKTQEEDQPSKKKKKEKVKEEKQHDIPNTSNFFSEEDQSCSIM